MRAEDEPKTSLRDASDLQIRLNALNKLRTFEQEGHHAHALEEEIDPTSDKVIAHEIEEIDNTQHGLNPHHEDVDNNSHRSRGFYARRRGEREALRLLYHWPL